MTELTCAHCPVIGWPAAAKRPPFAITASRLSPSDAVLRYESHSSLVRAVFDGCRFVCTLLSTVSIDSTLIVEL